MILLKKLNFSVHQNIYIKERSKRKVQLWIIHIEAHLGQWNTEHFRRRWEEEFAKVKNWSVVKKLEHLTAPLHAGNVKYEDKVYQHLVKKTVTFWTWNTFSRNTFNLNFELWPSPNFFMNWI